jgi:sugar-specific transcriptional regulator TrmB
MDGASGHSYAALVATPLSGVLLIEYEALSEVALSVYTALTRASADLDALAIATGLSVDAVSEGLEALKRQRLVQHELIGPGRFIAVAPAQALGSRLETLRIHHAREAARIHQVETDFHALQSIATASSPTGMWEDVIGEPAVITATRRMLRAAEVEVCAFLPGKPSATEIGAMLRHSVRLEQRGVAFRVICLDSFGACLRTGLSGAAGLPGTTHIRSVATLPLAMLLIDGRLGLLESRSPRIVDGPPPRAHAALVRHEGVMRALNVLFGWSWTHGIDVATPLTDVSPTPAEGLGRMETALLSLYAEGATDEAAARALGLSTRTVRRVAAALCGQVGARSRFELGVAAARGGWI